MMPIQGSAFPSLTGWEETRDSLHAYTKVICAFARVLAEPDPMWWHVSLKLEQDLLWTDELDPDGQRSRLGMDLAGHAILVHNPAGIVDSVDMRSGFTADEMAARLIQISKAFGIEPELPRDKYVNDAPRSYDPAAAQSYLQALKNAFDVQSQFRAKLSGDRGPVQLWPHNFDQAFEWFSGKMITPEGSGAQDPVPAQINFGFAPGDATHPGPYFYSNPWPFDTSLKEHALPNRARWFEASWTGSLLPYEDLAGDPAGLEKLAEYYQRIFDLASPLLTP
jgi:hypothetical protein